MSGWESLDEATLQQRLADLLARLGEAHDNEAHDNVGGRTGVLRIAVDGAACTHPDTLAASLTEPLNARGRPVAHVLATSFWHDASLRLEHGREDAEAYLSWLDAEALRREVLVPARESGTYLPTLRDPATNRSTREHQRRLDAGTVLLVSGSLLLGLGLPFDRVVHLSAPDDQLARDTPPEQQWTLPAYATYDATVAPVETADVVIRVGRRRPAVRGL